MAALVLVQISTLDAYADHFGLDEAYKLARRWRNAVLSFNGRVIIIDQKWPYRDPESKPRYKFVWGVELARPIDFVHYDEPRDWDGFLESWIVPALSGVERVDLGGLWYGSDGSYGAVAEAKWFLEKQFDVRVILELTADLKANV